MMATKLGMIKLSPMFGCRPSMPERARPQSGEIDAETEIEIAQHAHIDAQHRDSLEVERAGGMRKPRRVRLRIRNRPHHRRDQHHHEHAISGDEEERVAQRFREPVRDLKGQALRAQIKRVRPRS